MKILLATHIYPPAVDGGSKVIFKLGQYFQSQGHQIKVLTSNCYSTDDFTHPTTHHTPQGLPVITFLHRPLKLFPFLKPFSKGPIFNPLSLISYIRYQPDLIIAGPLPTAMVLYARLIKFFSPKSKILINASFHPTDPDFHSPLLIKALKSADYLWTLTDYETNYFHKNFNIPFSKMINVGNGIDKSFLTSAPAIQSSNYLIFVGSLAAHKVINSLLQLQQKIYLCGQKTLYSQNLHTPKNIIIKNNLTDDQIKKLIQQSSILILPSSQESFGLVLLEAWACHKPVITSDIPQLSEMITKSGGGLTFKLGDSNDLNNKIELLLKNPKLYSKLAHNGFLFAKNHTWDKIGDTICQKIGF